VCTAVASQESPALVSLGTGGAVVVWADARSGEYDIYAQRLSPDGAPLWAGYGVLVCGAEYDQQFPAAVADGAGGVIVVWQDGRKGDDGMEIYAQRLGPDGAAAWAAGGVPVCSHAPDLTDPPTAFSHVICSDLNGGAIVAWRDTRSDPILANTEIYAQRIAGTGAALWTANGVKVLGFTAVKWATRNPIIAPDGSGGAVIVWQDGRNSVSTGNDLYAQRVTAAGSAAWAANGIMLCNATGEQSYPDITSLNSGGAVVVWEDKRSGDFDIYAQRLDSLGTPAWGANGRSVCTSANNQRTPRVTVDGNGGCIVAWTDARSSALETDLYAQALDSLGNPLWTPQGAAACLAPGSQTRIRMAPSLPGMVMLTWMDTRNESSPALYDVYGQMLRADGLPAWAAEGVPLAVLPGSNQRLHQTESDGFGGAYSTWEDNRNAADWDVYAQRLSPWTPVSSTAEAKLLPAGSAVRLPARVVTAAFSGSFYIEETDRSSGLKVVSSSPVSPGDMVAVSGVTGALCEPLLNALLVEKTATAPVPLPPGVRAASLGGEGVGASRGLSNLGLLVRVWGRVTAREAGPPQSLLVSDGSATVRVYTDSTAAVGDYVTATGIASCEAGASGREPVLLTRSISDVQVAVLAP